MADNVKVLIGEKNGVELELKEEYELISVNIPYNNTTSGLTATDVKSAIDELATNPPPIETLTEFEAFSDNTQESTTSNAWVTKNNFPYTTSTKTAGEFVIDYSAQIGQSDKQKTVT